MTVKQYKTIKKAPLAWCVMIVVVQALQKNYLVELFSRNEFPILCCFLSSVAVFDINLPVFTTNHTTTLVFFDECSTRSTNGFQTPPYGFLSGKYYVKQNLFCDRKGLLQHISIFIQAIWHLGEKYSNLIHWERSIEFPWTFALLLFNFLPAVYHNFHNSYFFL